MRTDHAPQAKPSRGGQTRTRLLDLAEAAMLSKGYAATSIEELIAAAGITKSGFFYHFAEKSDLAKALLRRDNEHTMLAFTACCEAADVAHADPLDAYLDALDRFGAMAVSETRRPGCLIAAFAYQEAHFDEEHQALMVEAVAWRRQMMRARLERIAAKYPPRAPVDLDDLADMAVAMIQGGMVIDRIRDRARVTQDQVQLYRTFVRTLFAGPGR